MNEPLTFSIDIDVRFRDLDALGHVNNAVYFTYFEEGRKHLFHRLFADSDPHRFRFILAHICCDYLIPVKLGDRPVLAMVITHIGTKSFHMNYRLADRKDATRVFAKGESVQVGYDYQADRSEPLSERLKTLLGGYQK